jgi:hypothetical protein
MKTILTTVVIFTLLSSISFSISGWCCTQDCIEPFGHILGGDSVPAFSNCRETCVGQKQHYVEIAAAGDTKKISTYAGTEWQCVEYARRWLMAKQSIKFGIVKFAHQIWDLNSFEDVKTHENLKLKKYSNYHSTAGPRAGDLLLYSKKFLGTGHVAVIIGVEPNRVLIAEQNYLNAKWPDPNYSRQLLMTRDKDGFFAVHDEEILGWLRVDDDRRSNALNK